MHICFGLKNKNLISTAEAWSVGKTFQPMKVSSCNYVPVCQSHQRKEREREKTKE